METKITACEMSRKLTLNFIQEREVTDSTTIFVFVYDSLVMSYYFDQLVHGCVLEPLNSYM